MLKKEQKKPKISIIMAVFNEPEKHLRESIESTLNQTFKNFEFIIILDKPDNKKAEDIIKEYQKKDKRIVFLKNKKNIGLAASLNKGIKASRGEYIARMDADDILKPKRIEKQIRLIEKKSEIDLVFTWAKFIDKKGKIIKSFNPYNKKLLRFNKYFFEEHLLLHPSVLGKKEIFKNNLYDSKFLRSQDMELWLRMHKKGIKFSILEEYLIYYRIPETNNFNERIEKMRKYNFWTLKVLKKHFKNYVGIYYLKRYLKTIIYRIILKLPNNILKSLIKIKDKKKNGYH